MADLELAVSTTESHWGHGLHSLASEPITLLVHDGELDDVRDILRDLNTPFVERQGPPTYADEQTLWCVVVATPKRILEIDSGLTGSNAVRIAIVEGEARSLCTMLRKSGIDLIVRRPVHPAALRLLLLHSLYRRPEKRGTSRVVLGTPIRFRSGLRRHKAILADLSTSGCRILSTHPVKPGKRLTLQLPTDVGSGETLALCGEAVRSEPADFEPDGTLAIAVVFQELAPGLKKRVADVVSAHLTGPASLPRSLARKLTRRPAEPGGESPTPADPSVGESAERRTNPRRAISRHMITTNQEATRVLIARDISIGGLRVDSHPTLSVGDKVQIALHTRAGDTPLVVSAQVDRDDGDAGLLLKFHELSETAKRGLDRMMDSLPILETQEGSPEAVNIIVSEILEHEMG